VIAWAVSRAIDGESWQNIVDALPAVARTRRRENHHLQRVAGARIELALKHRTGPGSSPPASRFIS
jgi:hypothetical protein